jgi:hypothetical protein
MKLAAKNRGCCRLRFLTALLFCLSVHSTFAQTNLVRVATNQPSIGYPEGVSICLSGNYAFLGTGSTATNMLWVYEISNPTNPLPVSHVSTIQAPTQMKILGHSIFAFEQGSPAATFEIFDVSNLTNPVKIAEIPVGHNGNNTRFAVFDNYIYLPACAQDIYSCTTGIWDVSNPTNPVSVGPADFRTGLILDTTGKLLYSIGRRESDLSVYDLSSPTNPVLIGQSEPFYFGGQANEIQVCGNYCYLSLYTNFIAIFDVSNPTNPIPVLNPYALGHAITGLFTVSGNYEYMVGFHFTILDLTDLRQPIMVAQTDPRDGFFNDIAISGNYAFCTAPYPILTVYWVGTSPPPLLSLEPRNINKLALSWPAPSRAFALQQNPDLGFAAWQFLTNAPLTTNSRNQVIIPQSSDRMSYRLISQ